MDEIYQIINSSLQTVAIIATLVIIYLQLRKQNQAIVTDTYERCYSDYTAIVRMFIDKPELLKFYDEISKNARWENWKSLSDDEKKMFSFVELHYEVCGRVFDLQNRNRDYKDEWKQWETWLKFIAKHPLFEKVHEDNKGEFSEKYQKFVDKIIKENDGIVH